MTIQECLHQIEVARQFGGVRDGGKGSSIPPSGTAHVRKTTCMVYGKHFHLLIIEESRKRVNDIGGIDGQRPTEEPSLGAVGGRGQRDGGSHDWSVERISHYHMDSARECRADVMG